MQLRPIYVKVLVHGCGQTSKVFGTLTRINLHINKNLFKPRQNTFVALVVATDHFTVEDFREK